MPDTLSATSPQGLAALMAQFRDDALAGRPTAIPADWMQGRTTYGGLTAALSLAGLEARQPELPPLRSALVNFIGPAGGSVSVAGDILRRGGSAVFANADLFATLEEGAGPRLAARSVFTFGAARKSAFDLDFIAPPDVPGPDGSESFVPGEGVGPAFARHFEVKLARGGRPVSGSSEHDHFLWVRFREPTPVDMASMLALADMPPPAMLPMFKEFAPVSSITWMVNLLVDAPSTTDGWWLLESRADHAREGYSSQDLFIWNRELVPVATGRQSVAIFA